VAGAGWALSTRLCKLSSSAFAITISITVVVQRFLRFTSFWTNLRHNNKQTKAIYYCQPSIKWRRDVKLISDMANHVVTHFYPALSQSQLRLRDLKFTWHILITLLKMKQLSYCKAVFITYCRSGSDVKFVHPTHRVLGPVQLQIALTKYRTNKLIFKLASRSCSSSIWIISATSISDPHIARFF